MCATGGMMRRLGAVQSVKMRDEEVTGPCSGYKVTNSSNWIACHTVYEAHVCCLLPLSIRMHLAIDADVCVDPIGSKWPCRQVVQQFLSQGNILASAVVVSTRIQDLRSETHSTGHISQVSNAVSSDTRMSCKWYSASAQFSLIVRKLEANHWLHAIEDSEAQALGAFRTYHAIHTRHCGTECQKPHYSTSRHQGRSQPFQRECDVPDEARGGSVG